MSNVNKALLDNTLTLEEKLALIQRQTEAVDKENVKRTARGIAPIDPADATICDGCE